jgi:excisionase family DNA binding protein
MDLMTPKEAGEYLKISVNTLAAWRSKKRGPQFIKTGRTVKYSRADLDSYLKKNTVSSK